MSSPFSSSTVIAGERRDELVAAHPDVAVDPPQRHLHLVSWQNARNQATAWW